MNTENETIVSDDFYRTLRRKGLAEGYEPVPPRLQKTAEQILNGREIATMTAQFAKKARYEQRKARVRAANRRREAAIREAKAALVR